MRSEEKVKDFPSGIRALRNENWLKNPKWNEQLWRAEQDGADADIIRFHVAFIQRFMDLGIPMHAHTIVRTYDAQMALFKDGFSKDSPADGFWPHMAYAVDEIHSIDAYDLHRVQWDAIGHIGKEVAAANNIKIKWGGDFKNFWDPAHWELADWKERAGAPPAKPMGSPDVFRG